MLRELVAHSPLLAIPLGVLVLFLTVFVGAIVRAYATRKGAFDAVAALPLNDDHSTVEKGS